MIKEKKITAQQVFPVIQKLKLINKIAKTLSTYPLRVKQSFEGKIIDIDFDAMVLNTALEFIIEKKKTIENEKSTLEIKLESDIKRRRTIIEGLDSKLKMINKL